MPTNIANPASAPGARAASLIRLRRITKTFGEGQAAFKALRGVGLSIRKGEFVAIMGHSGSGKSTLLYILGCLSSPTSGTYTYEGALVDKLTTDQRSLLRRDSLGFVFQGFNLLARTSALENVEMPLLYRGLDAHTRRELAIKALREVGLGDKLDNLPSELSGGQQQRVAIARALVSNPSTIMADEPTGNLDSTTTREIMELLVRLNRKKGITIIMVTHENDVAAYAQRIIHISDGNISSDAANRRHGGAISKTGADASESANRVVTTITTTTEVLVSEDDPPPSAPPPPRVPEPTPPAPAAPKMPEPGLYESDDLALPLGAFTTTPPAAKQPPKQPAFTISPDDLELEETEDFELPAAGFALKPPPPALRPAPPPPPRAFAPPPPPPRATVPVPAPRPAPLPPPVAERKPAPIAPPVTPEPRKPDEAAIRTITIQAPIIVRDFATKLGVTPYRLVTELMDIGVFASVNQVIEDAAAVRISHRHNVLLEILQPAKELPPPPPPAPAPPPQQQPQIIYIQAPPAKETAAAAAPPPPPPPPAPAPAAPAIEISETKRFEFVDTKKVEVVQTLRIEDEAKAPADEIISADNADATEAEDAAADSDSDDDAIDIESVEDAAADAPVPALADTAPVFELPAAPAAEPEPVPASANALILSEPAPPKMRVVAKTLPPPAPKRPPIKRYVVKAKTLAPAKHKEHEITRVEDWDRVKQRRDALHKTGIH